MLTIWQRPALLGPAIDGGINLAPVVAWRAVARHGNKAKGDRIAHARAADGSYDVYAGDAI